MTVPNSGDNNTPSETRPSNGGNATEGMSVSAAAALLADSLNISVGRAGEMIRSYMTVHGVDARQAAVALSHGAAVPPDEGDDGTGSSSSGSGSSSGGSGSSGGGMSPEQRANAEASYLNTLVSWGILISPEVRSFVKGAVTKMWGSALFLQELRKTKFYAQRFPGIVRKNGTMRMTEAQYISGYETSRDYASTLGRNLTKQQYGAAIAAGSSPSEIRYKLDILDKIKSYGPQLQSFNDYLVARGIIKKPLNRQEMTDFVMGNRKDLQDEWTIANAAFQMEELASLEVGKPNQGNDLGFKQLGAMIKRFEALGGNMDEMDYVQMGNLISSVIPKNELYGAGIRKKDIVDMMLMGKNAASITKRVQTVLDTYELAVTQPGAQSQNQQGRVYQGTPRPGSE